MIESKRPRSRRHPIRDNRCQRLWAKAHRPDMALTMTFAFEYDEFGPHRTDFAIPSRESCLWLVERSRRLEPLGQQRWRS